MPSPSTATDGTAGASQALWRASIDLDVRNLSNWPAKWSLWDQAGLPPAVGAEVAYRTPELPEAAAQAGELDAQLYPELLARGARAAVADLLVTATDRNQLLDRRAFVALCGQLMFGMAAPQLPLPEGVAAGLPRPRLLRPLELALLRTVARDDIDVVLLRLLTGGANERETASIATAGVHVDDDRQVIVTLPGMRGAFPRSIVLAPDVADETHRLVADSGELLFRCGRDQSVAKRHKYLHGRLRRLLDVAGFADDTSVTVASITNTGMRAAADQFSLEAAAAAAGERRLGHLRQQLQLG